MGGLSAFYSVFSVPVCKNESLKNVAERPEIKGQKNDCPDLIRNSIYPEEGKSKEKTSIHSIFR